MSWLGDVYKFERSKLGNMAHKLKDHPERALIGAMDEAGSKVWGKILNKDWEPLVDKWGGATPDDYTKAQSEGINIGPGKSMHGIARAIAAAYTGRWLGGLGGGGTSAGGMGGNGMGAQEAFRGAEYAGSGGYGGGYTGYTGYGATGTGIPSQVNLVNAGGTMSTGGGLASRSMNYSQGQQEDRRRAPLYIDEVRYDMPSDETDYVPDDGFQPSSRQLKRPRSGQAPGAIERGVRGEDAIDRNGVEIAAIQAISKRIDQLQKRLTQLQRTRGR